MFELAVAVVIEMPVWHITSYVSETGIGVAGTVIIAIGFVWVSASSISMVSVAVGAFMTTVWRTHFPVNTRFVPVPVIYL